MQNKIDEIVFLKMRDAGEVLAITFRFIRENFKTLTLGILLIVIPFYIIGSILMISSIDGLWMDQPESQNLSSLGTMMLAMLFLGLGSVMLITYVNELMKYVWQHPGEPLPGVWHIWKPTRRYFWWNLLHLVVWFIVVWMFMLSMYIVFFLFMMGGIAGLSSGSIFIAIVMALLGIVSMLFVMLYTVSATLPMFFIATCEKTNIFSALSRSFSLMHATRSNFKSAMLTNLLAFFIQMIISSNIIIPILIIEGLIEYNSGESTILSGPKTFIKVFYGITYLISPFLYAIPLIGNGMNYFSMRERIDATGLRHRISEIGQQKDFDIYQYEED
ncbi:MAG: hypothetical protein IAE67_02275 [Candidatus Competibacteraceae bacterium]|nr:hypothetical protein [Candidatus Competibacteraceae bacterium]